MMNSTSQAGTPLRQRMIEDMRMRRLEAKTQQAYIRAVRKLIDNPAPRFFRWIAPLGIGFGPAINDVRDVAMGLICIARRPR